MKGVGLEGRKEKKETFVESRGERGRGGREEIREQKREEKDGRG